MLKSSWPVPIATSRYRFRFFILANVQLQMHSGYLGLNWLQFFPCVQNPKLSIQMLVSMKFFSDFNLIYYIQKQSLISHIVKIFYMLSYCLFNINYLAEPYSLECRAMKTTKSQWTQQEVSLLQELIPVFNSKKWKNISRIFKQRGFDRSEIECRQKWVNFFNPKINNDEWSKRELEALYDSYQKHKTQWYLIQKMLPGRTQNKIKNRFYGTIRNFVRFIVRFFNKETKSYSTQINRLSPKYLNIVYESQDVFRFLNGQIPKVIKELDYLFDRSQFSKKVKQNKQLYLELFEKLIQIFNSNEVEPEESENSPSDVQQRNDEEINNHIFPFQQDAFKPEPYFLHPYMLPPYFFYYPNCPQ